MCEVWSLSLGNTRWKGGESKSSHNIFNTRSEESWGIYDDPRTISGAGSRSRWATQLACVMFFLFYLHTFPSQGARALPGKTPRVSTPVGIRSVPSLPPSVPPETSNTTLFCLLLKSGHNPFVISLSWTLLCPQKGQSYTTPRDLPSEAPVPLACCPPRPPRDWLLLEGSSASPAPLQHWASGCRTAAPPGSPCSALSGPCETDPSGRPPGAPASRAVIICPQKCKSGWPRPGWREGAQKLDGQEERRERAPCACPSTQPAPWSFTPQPSSLTISGLPHITISVPPEQATLIYVDRCKTVSFWAGQRQERG